MKMLINYDERGMFDLQEPIEYFEGNINFSSCLSKKT